MCLLKQLRWVFKRSCVQDWPESRWKRVKPFRFSDFSGDFKVFGMKAPSTWRLSDGFPPSWQRNDGADQYMSMVESYTAGAESWFALASWFLFCIFHFRPNMSWAQPVSVRLWRLQSLHVTVSLWYMWFRSHKGETSTAKLHRVYLWQALSSGGILEFSAKSRLRSCGVDSDYVAPKNQQEFHGNIHET